MVLPMTLMRRPSVASPTGTVIGAPVSMDLGAAREAVGGVHGDGADLVVAEVLLHLADHFVAVPSPMRTLRAL